VAPWLIARQKLPGAAGENCRIEVVGGFASKYIYLFFLNFIVVTGLARGLLRAVSLRVRA
jgi:hypothetical protein